MQFRKPSTTTLNEKQERKVIKYSHDLSNTTSLKLYVNYGCWKQLFIEIHCLVTLVILHLFI